MVDGMQRNQALEGAADKGQMSHVAHDVEPAHTESRSRLGKPEPGYVEAYAIFEAFRVLEVFGILDRTRTRIQ